MPSFRSLSYRIAPAIALVALFWSAPGLSAQETDPRVGLAPATDAEEAISNLRLLSNTPKPGLFDDKNSDLAFRGDHVIQGNYNGFMIWDVSDPESPALVTKYFCPASQSDVSVYGDLLFVSAEGRSSRLDCGAEGVADTVSSERILGIRIFDISDLENPEYIANVQTCRGSHTHSVLVDPDDPDNVYVYISGSAPVRSPSELPGCSDAMPDEDPNTALFRIEVIKVPLDAPEEAAIVSSPRILDDLEPVESHGEAEADRIAREERVAEARAEGGYVATIRGREHALSDRFVEFLLQQVVKERGGEGEPTPADSAALREDIDERIERMFGADRPRTGPTQCHDITLYPAIGLAGGACGGYGLLLDITDPVHPERVEAVADTNFSYWHSATFDNEGEKLLFSDEWGGGSGAKCRATDPVEWGANAIFTIDGEDLAFESYYKLPAPQTELENCVAHNGSLIPIPGRDVMVQGWYQGGVSVFDWTDAGNPVEIAYFDRGPVDDDEMQSGGSWSAYWYNGLIVSSEIARGLDILELVPSEHVSRNEIDAAKTATLDYLNVQGQQMYEWPPSFALAGAYLDQLERDGGLAGDRIEQARATLADAEGASGDARREALTALATELDEAVANAGDPEKTRTLAEVVEELAAAEG
ncbi:MAG: hypothetical protein R3199_10605 [Gemmatimonadota bacterium]|nr:hypothetical protein [Gemmatimonadota bacterium]